MLRRSKSNKDRATAAHTGEAQARVNGEGRRHGADTQRTHRGNLVRPGHAGDNRAYQLERKLHGQVQGGDGEREKERERTHQERNVVSPTALTSQIHLPLCGNGLERICAKFTRGAIPPNLPLAAVSPAQSTDRKAGFLFVVLWAPISPERNENKSLACNDHKRQTLFTKLAAD